MSCEEGLEAGAPSGGGAAHARAGRLQVRGRVLNDELKVLPVRIESRCIEETHDRQLTGIITAALLAASSPGPRAGSKPEPHRLQGEGARELITKLKRDIFQVDRSIGDGELISKSRNAPYLPICSSPGRALRGEERYVYYCRPSSVPRGPRAPSSLRRRG